MFGGSPGVVSIQGIGGALGVVGAVGGRRLTLRRVVAIFLALRCRFAGRRVRVTLDRFDLALARATFLTRVDR